MSVLHIVNKSPSSCATLHSCLRYARPGDALLLIEDGVYAATGGNLAGAALRGALERLQVHALRPDLEARGMVAQLIEGVTLVDYGGFVDLAALHHTSHAWL